MICIILRQPNGNGTYTPRIGLTTSDSTVSIGGVNCVHGYLSSVSELSHRINISGARGATAEPIEWGFDLIDWEATARRSVGILDGSVQLIGWVASLYVLQPSTGIWSSAVLSETAFEVVGAPVKDGLISISCRESRIGNRQTVGFGAGDDRVGLVVGGRDVTVKTPGLSDPVAIEYQENTGWFDGSPNSPQAFTGPRTAATSKAYDAGSDTYAFIFSCFPGTGPDLYAAATAGGVYITGRTYSQDVSIVGISSDVVDVRVSQEFYDNEDPKDVALYSVEIGSRAIVGGADSLTGFVNSSGATVKPLGNTSFGPDGVLLFAPRLTSADGFIAHTLIPCSIAFASGWTPQSLGGTNEWSYYGSTTAINTDGTTVPAWEALDSDLFPVSPQSQFAARIKTFLASELKLPLRIQRNDDGADYDRYEIDVRSRWTAKCPIGLVYTAYGDKQEPFSKQGDVTDAIYGPPGMAIASGVRELQGPGTYDPFTSFATFEEINTSPASFCGLQLSAAIDLICTWQLSAVRLYGVSTLAFGSSYAVVTPGASPWWPIPDTPSETARYLLNATGGNNAASVPSWLPDRYSWGRAFDQDTTLTEAATDIADEFWVVFGSGANDALSASSEEILAPPAFTLGDRNDIITEPVVEYDEWAGEFRRRAYIAHVDEEYDSGNPDRYFGGWDTTGGSWGLTIWNACRKAWLHHGIKASETYQSPSISNPSTLGRMWANAQRSGRTRIGWLSMQARYMTVRIPETYPLWWAGNTVTIPTTVAGWSGYDLSEVAGVQLVVTEKTWDPVTLTTVFEVAMPPVVPGNGGDVIQQTASTGDDLIKQTSSISDNILQQVGN